MARPSFSIQHLIFCTGVSYPDVRRPLRNNTLDGVDFVFGVPPNTEFPCEPMEFWLYARIYSTSDDIGDSPPLLVTCAWLDDPSGREVVVWSHAVGPVSFRRPRVVFEKAWVFRNYDGGPSFRFPHVGRYAFRLGYSTRKWPNVRVKAEEFISVEVVP